MLVAEIGFVKQFRQIPLNAGENSLSHLFAVSDVKGSIEAIGNPSVSV
jgi:hypothetical protein